MAKDNYEGSEFPKKFATKLPDGFADSMNSASLEELKAKILESERHAYEIDQEKAMDQKLNGARELAKELNAPYREAKGCEAAKIQYCLFVLESRGVKV